MFKHVSLIGFALLSSALLSGCLDGPAGPAGPALSGTLSGMVTLVSSDGTQHPGAGVAVSIDGTSKATVTDSIGQWSFANLSTGTYTIAYKATGYGESKSNDVGFVGGGSRDIGVSYLCQPPSFSLTSVSTFFPIKNGDSASVYLAFAASDSTVTGPYKTVLFFGKDSSVSWAPATYSTVSVQTGAVLHAGLDSIRLQPMALATAGFSSGDTAYVRAYIASAGTDNSGYTDIATEHFVYTDINPKGTNALAVIVP